MSGKIEGSHDIAACPPLYAETISNRWTAVHSLVQWLPNHSGVRRRKWIFRCFPSQQILTITREWSDNQHRKRVPAVLFHTGWYLLQTNTLKPPRDRWITAQEHRASFLQFSISCAVVSRTPNIVARSVPTFWKRTKKCEKAPVFRSKNFFGSASCIFSEEDVYYGITRLFSYNKKDFLWISSTPSSP